MKITQTHSPAVQRRISTFERAAKVAASIMTNATAAISRVDDSILRKSLARDAAEQKAHEGSAAHAKLAVKDNAKAVTAPQSALRAPSAAMPAASKRVSPVASASSLKAQGFAARARKALV